jgi:hypothetical protein
VFLSREIWHLKLDGDKKLISTKTNNSLSQNHQPGNPAAATKKESIKILLLAVILLVVIMAYTGVLNFMTFAENYNKSLVNTYSVAGNELVRKIEYALYYGKSIDNFYGMSDTLKELKEIVEDVEQVNIVSLRGEILYDLNGFVTNKTLPEDLLKTAAFQQGLVNDNCSHQFLEGKHYLFLKISS